jgi:hypothetical protein
MVNKILLLFLISLSVFSQDEKRLALVIGNANYDKGELKNPVNDARLIASTLDSLNFDVILKENLATKRDMLSAIKEFGSKRSEYDVAFVYYAGHGIQVDDENFLLPTKEVFEEEFDVMDYGVSVQNIMRYLTAQTNEVNILILDACRDNPFESNWNTTRSLKSGGLAKIPPPTGSLIAFSTNSGQTAPDGNGDNSTYTVSLAKNMLLKDTSIDQVFRNVRAEVLAQTNGIQRPVEATQLTGQTYFLNQGTFEEDFIEIDNIFLKGQNISRVIEISTQIISKQPDNYRAFEKRGHAHYILRNYEQAILDYEKSLQINPNSLGSYKYFITTRNAIIYAGLLDTYEQINDYENYKIKLENFYLAGKNNPYYYREATYLSSSKSWQKKNSENSEYEKIRNLVYSFGNIDDSTILSYSKDHSLAYEGFDPVFRMKTVAYERLLQWKTNNEELDKVELREEIIIGEEYLAKNTSKFNNDSWSFTAVWYHLSRLYKRMMLVDTNFVKKFIDRLYSNLQYEDLALTIEGYSELSNYSLLSFSFNESFNYGVKSVEIFNQDNMTEFLSDRYLSENYGRFISNLFLIHEDYINVILYTDKFLNAYAKHFDESPLFFKNNQNKISINTNLCDKIINDNPASIYRALYTSYLSNKLIDGDEQSNNEDLLKIIYFLDYYMTTDDEFSFEIHKLNTINNNQSKELYLIKDSSNITDKFNRFFWDSFSDAYINDKNIHSSALNEDKIIARKMYNVIKNVEMFSNDVLDNNTFIDKNIFEIPVFDEILEND